MLANVETVLDFSDANLISILSLLLFLTPPPDVEVFNLISNTMFYAYH
jgi:hypothetical protein